MSRIISCFVLIVVLASAVLSVRPASARVLLKPRGGQAMPLRMKMLDADVSITGQFASTRLVMTFQNETRNWKPEVEFFYTAPPHSVVTYFAYWFRDEKVVARVVEKERAAMIYDSLTRWGVDPALIEMVGQNTFRARIFPVVYGEDLRIEMHLVQVLTSDVQGVLYQFPLRQQQEEIALPPGQSDSRATRVTPRQPRGTYEKLNLDVHIKPDSNITRVLNNYNLPARKKPDGIHLTLSQLNYRPPMDLRLRLARQPRQLHAVLYAARSGGRDGFFTLALTPGQKLDRPRLEIKGIRTYDVLPHRLPALKAHQVITVVGRYKGSGPATITLSGYPPNGSGKATQRVSFSARRENNNLATKLWATRRINALGISEKNRAQIIALSQRFTLPSRFTSWLAIPKAEMESFRRIEKEAKILSLTRNLASEIILGRENKAPARRLRQQLIALRRPLHQNYGGGDERKELERSVNNVMSGIAHDLARAWVEERLSAKPDTVRLKALHGQLQHVARIANKRQPDWRLTPDEMISDQQSWMAREKMSELAADLAREQYTQNPHTRRIAALRAELARIERITGVNAASHIQGANYVWTRGKMHELAWGIAREQAQPQPNAKQIASLRQQLDGLAKAAGQSSQRFVDIARTRLIYQLSRELEIAQNTANVQQRYAEAERLEKRREELLERFADVRGRYGDPLISIEAPEDAAQVIALLPSGETKRLLYNADSKKWEARFDIPMYASEGEYVITVIVVLKDGTRQILTMRYYVDVTPPRGSGQAALVTSEGERSTPSLRLELDGSDDTARVFALLPWGEKVALSPSTVQQHRFFALVPVPSTHQGKPVVVTYVLTDKAHNRTMVTVDMER